MDETPPLSDVKRSSSHPPSSVSEMNPEDEETNVSLVNPELCSNFRSETAERTSQPETSVGFQPETVTPDLLLAAVERELEDAAARRPEAPRAERDSRIENSPSAADTRLIPTRPENPFTTGEEDEASAELALNDQEEEDPHTHLLCLLENFDSPDDKRFQRLEAAPDLTCVLDAHLTVGEDGVQQRASGSLLGGTAVLLALGERRLRERRASRVHSRGQLQAALRRDQKLLRVLGSQSAFVRSLFHRQPGALERREDERVQLEVRARALQREAVEHDAAAQRKLQEWSRWEENCNQLSRVLDESEAFVGGEETDDGDDEASLRRRLDACQHALIRLDSGRVALGILLDQGKALQAEPSFDAPFAQTGGALELRWRSAVGRTRQEIQRCEDIREIRARFQADFASVSEWLDGAERHLDTLSARAESPEASEECVRGSLIELLDFSTEVEKTRALKTSASKDATQLLHLKESDSPDLRARLAQQDQRWNRLTSRLTRTLDRLQQCFLAEPLPVVLLADLEVWLKKAKIRLDLEKENVLKAQTASQLDEILQRHQALKAAVSSGQLLLDSLSNFGPQTTGKDVQARRADRTQFAEKLGECKLQWLYFERELHTQMCEVQQTHHTCADRERHLRHLRAWIRERTKRLDEWKGLTAQTLARQTLQQWEEAARRGKEVASSLQELKSRRADAEKNRELPCDVAFWEQAEGVCLECEDLNTQMEMVKSSLEQTLDDWSLFHSRLAEATLVTTRARYTLQHQRLPLFSLEQAEEHSHFLQQLQTNVGKGDELWESAGESCQRLVKNLNHKAARLLTERVDGERRRWKDLQQELKDEEVNARKTLSLWHEHSDLSERCRRLLQQLWRRWEEPSGSSDAADTMFSVKELQIAAEGVQSSIGDVLEASKALIGRLEPQAANTVQSETRLVSCDVLLVNQVTSMRLKRLRDDSDQRQLLLTRLARLEKATKFELEAGVSNIDYVKQVFWELSDLIPSLVELRDATSGPTLGEAEAERARTLQRIWSERLNRTSELIRKLQAERQRSQNFQEKCKDLKSIQTKLDRTSTCTNIPSYSGIQEKMVEFQKLQAEVIIGRQLVRGLQRDAAEALDDAASGDIRSKLVSEAAQIKENWFQSLSMTEQSIERTKELLSEWNTYRRGSELLRKLMSDIDFLLPSTGSSVFMLNRLQSSLSDYQRAEDSLALHYPVYVQTLEAGKRLCEAAAESDCRTELQSELRAMKESWEQRTSQLESRKDRVNTTVQMWSKCQDGINSFVSELDELEQKKLRGPEDHQDEEAIQELELSLQRLAGGLNGLTSMKTDLSQYVAASDSALLEQQLEQLHFQWEELCNKVSLRRQEIADRLNAWTIFNDKNKEFCDWLTQMENKVCHSGELSIEEMVEKLKKDCMEEINLFSENKSHLKQLGEQLLLASDEAKQTQVNGSLHGINQRWHSLFHHIEARVKKLKETLVTVQQLDKNMSNLRSWLCRMEAELSRPITYSVCHQQEIQKRLAEQQELQRDIEQHTEGVASVLSLCDVLLRDEDAAGGGESESDSLQETSRSLDQRWRTICAMALDRRLRIEETWTLWCKFLNDYSRFEDWLKMAERTAANPNSADVLFTVAKEELKKFEGFQRQVNERLTQLELVNNQYRRLARENRTDRASQLRAMVNEGNRRWDALHRRVTAVLRRLKHFTSQREDFEGTRENMLVWLTELDLQLTNVEHFSESDVHHKILQLNSFQKEIALNTERIDGLIVFGEGLIQKSSPQDAALIEDELEELHCYCQEVFSRLVRFHQRLSQPTTVQEEPELSASTLSLEPSLELIGRPLLGRSFSSLPATPTHLLASPLERSGRETPASVDSLPLEWDHTGDVGGSSTHEDDEEEEEEEEEGPYFSALSVTSRSMGVCASPRWPPSGEPGPEAPPTLTSTPVKPGYLRLMSECSGSIENIKRLSLMLDDEDQPEDFGLTGLSASDQQSGVIERWELLQAQSSHDDPDDPQDPASHLNDITAWLDTVIPELERLQRSEPAASIEELESRARELKEMQKKFGRYKSAMLSVNVGAERAPDLQEKLASVNRGWSRACTALQCWDVSLRKTLLRCQEFHQTLQSLLLWLAHAESRRYAVDIGHPDTNVSALQTHKHTLTELQQELQKRQNQQISLQDLWSQLQPHSEDGAEDDEETREKLHVTGNKLKLLLRQVEQDVAELNHRLGCESTSAEPSAPTEAPFMQRPLHKGPQHKLSKKTTGVGPLARSELPVHPQAPTPKREGRDSAPPRSFFHRVFRAAFPLHLLLLLLLLLPCLIPTSESDASCAVTNNFARSFYPMLRYTNGPPPT